MGEGRLTGSRNIPIAASHKTHLLPVTLAHCRHMPAANPAFPKPTFRTGLFPASFSPLSFRPCGSPIFDRYCRNGKTVYRARKCSSKSVAHMDGPLMGRFFEYEVGKKRERKNRKSRSRKVFPPVCRLKIESSLKSSGQILGKVKFSLEIVMR